MASSSLKTSIAPQSDPQGELSRELSLFQITMMGLGMMIGAGVFIGMGVSIEKAGPGGLVLTFALNGLIAMFTAMSFAELSSAIPRAGGAYNFARIGFGRRASFLAGWMEWFASSVAGSMYALTSSLYTVRFVRVALLGQTAQEGVTWVETALAVATAALFIYINYRGASETGKIGAIITLGQTVFVVIIGLVGLWTAWREPGRLQNFAPFMPHGWASLLATMGFTYVAFEGYEVIAQAGDEAIDPRRNLPKAMLYSVLIVTVIYVLVAFATVVSVRAEDPDLMGRSPAQWIGGFAETGFAAAVSKLMPFGNVVLTLAVLFSATSALNATIYSATRASYALGRDKMLPAIFSLIHSKRNTPYGALTCTAAIVLLTAAFLPVKDVTASASLMFLFLFFLVNLCVIKIRRCMADELHYGFVMPLFPLFPILAIVCQVVLVCYMHEMSGLAIKYALLWVCLGWGVYQFYGRTRATVTEDEIQILEEQSPQKDEVRGKFPIMVAVANPDSTEALVRSTYQLCGAKDAHVELIHMVSIPDQIALRDGLHQSHPGKEAITVAMRELSQHFPISTTIRYCRNVARGIVAAVRQKRIRMLVLGWHGGGQHSHFSIGSTIDPIIEQSPCDVVVLKECGADRVFRRVLVPLAGGPNGTLALEIASILCDASSPQPAITALHVDRGGHFNIDRYVKEQVARRKLDPGRFELRTLRAKDPVQAILDESSDYDLLVLGTTYKSILMQFATRSIPEEIARRCTKPTVMVKANVGVQSWIKRWI